MPSLGCTCGLQGSPASSTLPRHDTCDSQGPLSWASLGSQDPETHPRTQGLVAVRMAHAPVSAPDISPSFRLRLNISEGCPQGPFRVVPGRPRENVWMCSVQSDLAILSPAPRSSSHSWRRRQAFLRVCQGRGRGRVCRSPQIPRRQGCPRG